MKNYKLHKILIGGFNTENTCPDLPHILNTTRDNIKRIIAIGDIHGDLDLAINCLSVAGLIQCVNEKCEDTVTLIYTDNKPRYYKWIAEKTIAVQVGDQIDRCRPKNKSCENPEETYQDENSDIKILIFFYELHKLAIKKKCGLYSLLGNHELLNVLGNLNYVSYKGLDEYRENGQDNLLKGRKDIFSRDSKTKIYGDMNISTFLGCTRISALVVDGYLFVHAGILDKLINKIYEDKKVDKKNTVQIINEIIKKWLLNATFEEKDAILVKKLLGGKVLSPFWPRIFGNIQTNLPADHKLCTKHVNPVLEYLDIKGIVVGHTPQLKININSTCDNKVWRVDVASSKAFEYVVYPSNNNKEEIRKGRLPQVLEIILGSNQDDDVFNVLVMSE